MNEIYGAWLDGVEIPRHEHFWAAATGGAAVEIVIQAYDDKCCA